MSFFDWFRSKAEIDAQRAEMLGAIDADQKCTREMMPQGVQEWEIDSCRSYKTLGNPQGLEVIDPFRMMRNIAAEEYLDALNFAIHEKEQREKRKEKLKNPKSIYLRKNNGYKK